MNTDEQPTKVIRGKTTAPQVQAQRAVVRPENEHKHQTAAGRTTWFDPSCRACVKADKARAALPADELANTLFLYPRACMTLAETWLAERYPNMDVEHGCELPIWQICSNPAVRIVCVRPLANVGSALKPSEVVRKDPSDGQMVAHKTDARELMAELCESEPLSVGELCFQTSGSAGKIMVSGRWNADELIARIFEAFPNHYVQCPDSKNTDENLTVGYVR